MAKPFSQPASDCWADLFEDRDLARHLRRIHGPGVYLNVRGAGAGFGRTLGGLRAGPSAYVLIFHHGSPADPLGWLLPGESIGDLGDFAPAADSLRIEDHPPERNEPAYTSYIAHFRRGQITRRATPRKSGRMRAPATKKPRSKRNGARKQ